MILTLIYFRIYSDGKNGSECTESAVHSDDEQFGV